MKYAEFLKAVTKLALYVGEVALMTTAEKVVEYFQKKDTFEYHERSNNSGQPIYYGRARVPRMS